MSSKLVLAFSAAVILGAALALYVSRGEPRGNIPVNVDVAQPIAPLSAETAKQPPTAERPANPGTGADPVLPATPVPTPGNSALVDEFVHLLKQEPRPDFEAVRDATRKLGVAEVPLLVHEYQKQNPRDGQVRIELLRAIDKLGSRASRELLTEVVRKSPLTQVPNTLRRRFIPEFVAASLLSRKRDAQVERLEAELRARGDAVAAALADELDHPVAENVTGHRARR